MILQDIKDIKNGMLVTEDAKVSLGEHGLDKSWQGPFPKMISCEKCNGESKIGFVVYEGMDEDDKAIWPRNFIQFVTDLKGNSGGLWLHDCVSVAVYFCRQCLSVSAIFNQA